MLTHNRIFHNEISKKNTLGGGGGIANNPLVKGRKVQMTQWLRGKYK